MGRRSGRLLLASQAVRGPDQPTPAPGVPARPPVPPLAARVPSPGHSRLEQILAESGVHPRAARRRHSRE